MKSRTLAVLAAVVTGLSGMVVAASPAVARASTRLAIYSGSITVKTSNGKQWSFSLNASQLGANDDLSLSLVRKLAGGTESHYWDVPVSSSSLTFNRNTGHGKLKTQSSTSQLTTINMNFSATNHHSDKCISGHETDYAGNFSGQATLSTHLKGGGTVGGSHLSFKSGTTHLLVDNNCIPSLPINNRCSKSMSFDDSAAGQHSMFGFADGSDRFIEVSHNVAIAHPAGATRSDVASTRPSTAPTFNRATKTVKVSGSSGLVTGSGRIVASSLSQSHQSCKLNGVTHTEVQTLSSTAAFTNTSGHPLVGHTILTGPIRLANGGDASFDVETWH